MTANATSYVYVGLAGETGPGRPVQSGLYRMGAGDSRWELVTRGLPEAPAIRAIAAHPDHAETVYVGTQHGPYRSTDHGERWEKLDVPLVTGSGNVSVAYGGPALAPGYYQFRAVSWREKKGGSQASRTYISATEDLRGVFVVK